MLGSRNEPRLTGGRTIVWSLDRTGGVPVNDVLPKIVSFVEQYGGDKSELMFGYWESGDAIVITAPSKTQ
jgi:hypothetical protein